VHSHSEALFTWRVVTWNSFDWDSLV
jgi:hypothetical protein